MSTENPVFKILVTAGNTAPLAAGLGLSSLTAGKIGIFNSHTNLSVDGTVAADCRDIYLAVGTSDGDIVRSAGQLIQNVNMKAITFKPYLASVPKIVEIGGFKAKCNTDYAIKIEYRNQQAYGSFGYNGLKNTYNYTTGCCADTCDTCDSSNSNGAELATGLVANINADPNQLVVASLFAYKINWTVGAAAAAAGTVTFTVGSETFNTVVASGDSVSVVAGKMVATINSTTTSGYTATNVAGVVTVYPKSTKTADTATAALVSAGGTSVTMTTITHANGDIADGAAFQVSYPGAGLAIRLTTANGTNTPFNGNIPVKFYNAKETDIIVSLVENFSCNGTVTTIQNLQFEDGNGINLAYDEYVAGGWDGKPGPYRTSAVTGLQKGSYDGYVDKAANYNTIVLEYDQFSVGGWQEYRNNLRTVIAIPCADATTLAGLVGFLDAIFTQFGPMTNDATGIDCTNTNVTTINDYTKDGIEILA